MKVLKIGLLICVWVIPMNISAQVDNREKTTQEILSALNKKEHRVVERHGIRVEKYREIRSDPVVREDLRSYSGTYSVPDLGYSITIQVESDGSTTGHGYENSSTGQRKSQRFILKDGKIVGALLTAGKIFEGGKTKTFTGLFINRSTLSNPTDKGNSSFGIGVVSQPVDSGDGVRRSKLFYQRQ